MKKISVQSLNNLFTFLEKQPASVLWIRSKEYERQLYLSGNFEKIWGYPTEKFYNDPKAFNEVLYTSDKISAKEMVQKDKHDENDTTYFYRIQTPHGEIKHIKDWHYLLTDEESNPIGFTGFAQIIPEQQWEEESQRLKNSDKDEINYQLQKYIFDILKNELHLQTKETNAASSSREKLILKSGKRLVELTQREIECLTHLAVGKSAKQTASIMNVSPRTIEFHLDNIKEKAQCRTKLELLSKVIINK